MLLSLRDGCRIVVVNVISTQERRTSDDKMLDTKQAMDAFWTHADIFKNAFNIEEGFYGINKTTVATTLSIGGAAYFLHRMLRKSPPEYLQPDLDYWWGDDSRRVRDDVSIRPFTVEFSDEMVSDLRRRLNAWRAPPAPLQGVGFRYGFNTSYLSRVVRHWRESYRFAARAQLLNTYPHYKTNIQGLDIHFIRVQPSVPSVETVPLLLLHGWPGSVREFYGVIPALTAPASGRDFVFEVIVPSLPGYGWSEGTSKPGLGSVEVAVIMRNLMHRLGFEKFYVQGGDWGAAIGSALSTLFPGEVLGFHSNMMRVNTRNNNVKWLLGSFFPYAVTDKGCEDRLYPVSKIIAWIAEETGYMHIQATKPDTVGVGLSDSPVGLLAYILEKFSTWTDPAYRDLEDGGLERTFKLDDLLDNIMIYWSTNCITTSMRLYAESMGTRISKYQMEKRKTPVPTWVLKARHEIFYHPDGFIRTKHSNLMGSTIVHDGGHFFAFQLPEVLAEDIFKAVQKFKDFHNK